MNLRDVIPNLTRPDPGPCRLTPVCDKYSQVCDLTLTPGATDLAGQQCGRCDGGSAAVAAHAAHSAGHLQGKQGARHQEPLPEVGRVQDQQHPGGDAQQVRPVEDLPEARRGQRSQHIEGWCGVNDISPENGEIRASDRNSHAWYNSDGGTLLSYHHYCGSGL